MDMLRRSLAGVIVYAFILPVIFWPLHFVEAKHDLAYILCGCMFLISVLRLIHYYFSKPLYKFSARLWFLLFALFSLMHAGILGFVFTLAIFDERFTPIIHISMLATAGISVSALFALSPRIRFALLNLSFLMMPVMFTGFLTEEYIPLASMMLVFLLYISGIGIRSNREYRRSFDIEIELEAQRKELETLNQTDALTSIYNRGYFNQHFEDQWQYAMRHELEIAILLIDVDHFKAINDTHGHLAGDACLVNLAYAINKTVNRSIDVAARYGGEEFVVLLSGCNTEQARSMAQKIEQAIQDHKFVHEGTVIPVTVSIGIATTMPKPKQKSSTLIDQADQALYQAKAQGRNRSIVFTEDE
ncbi:GGDEF domain-containing protein [Paraglaciecola chathamensis]|uniref:diguanylate cyclase n=1 Tax=Paraglaciecola chathamensis S18K6 TaxID=1127672 RepID=A0AAV3UUQ5_9ALTE|nr:GGDEF domain-containing protein [Paraglaciecola chathamensis]GAC08801.1 diguanylate cyclase [Paraglaciecola chathamensis S18K6]